MINENMKLSPMYDATTINQSNDRYGVFITGSDQVFNYACSDFDKNYFLSFVDDKQKINSYAASFGISEIPNEYRAEYGSTAVSV